MQEPAVSPPVETLPKRRQWLFAAVALTLGTVISIGLLELGCRLFRPIYLGPPDYFTNFFMPDAKLGFKMPANFNGLYQQDYELTYATNAQGLRDRDFDAYPAEGVMRILAVGDSWTFGLGVDLPATWPKQLEYVLRERGIAAEVINTGVSGYSTLTYAKVLKKFHAVYHPQAVIVMTCANDPGGDLSVAEQDFTFAVKQAPSPLRSFLKKHSHLAMNLRVAYLSWFTPQNSYSFMNTLTLRSETDPTLQRGYSVYQGALADMRDFAQQQGLLFFVSAIPMGDGFLEKTRAISQVERMDYISLESLKGDTSIDGQNSGGHYNATGYRRIAEILAATLEQRL